MPAKKIHPADAADRAMIAEAVSFNVHLRISPSSKINRPAATLAEAVAIADEIQATRPSRNVLVYAIMESGATVPVPADMRTAARAPDFIDEPAAEIGEESQAEPEFLPGFVKNAFEEIIAEAQPEAQPEAPAPAPKARKARKAPAKAEPAPAAPEAPAPVAVAAEAPRKRRSAADEAAERGELPPVPDFSANTHKPFRKKLAEVVALMQAGDVAGLRAYPIEPKSSSRKAICRFRDLAVVALEVRARG